MMASKMREVKPSTKKLLPYVAHVASNWYELGAMLLEEVQESQLKLIQSTYGSDVRKCCLAMLQYWMDTHPEATWDHLVIALRSPGIDLTAVASDMEKNFTVNHTHRDIDSSANAVDFAYFKNVADAFAALMRVFAKELREADFETIRTICLFRVGKRLRNEIGRTRNIHGLFTLLACNPFYFNWMDVEYLQTMAVASGNKRLEDMLTSYTDIVLSKTLGEIWNFIPSFHKTKTKYYSKIRARFHGTDPDNVTVEDLKKFEPKFAKKIALHIMQIDKGSLRITWCILAEEAYRTYLFALSIPQELHRDDFLQIGPWVVFHPQFVMQKLKKIHGMMITSTLLISYYHGLLMSSIDADLLIDKMCSSKLLTNSEQAIVSSGHSVYHRNQLLLEFVQHLDVNAVVTFCELVQEIWPQVGSQLIIALKCKDSPASGQPFGNLETKKNDVELTDTDTTSLPVYGLFLCLVNQIAKILQSDTLFNELIESCENLKASNVHNIALFSADQIKELSVYSKTSLLLLKLSPHFTWSNHSILRALVSSSNKAVKSLDEFESTIDFLQPITSYPIPCFSADMIPSDASTYTILAVRCKVELYESSLQYVYDVQSVMVEKCDITQHCLQLLAVRSDPTILYWTIPKCVVDLINTNVPIHSEYLYSRGVMEVLVYPDLLLTTGDDVCYAALAFKCEDQLFSQEQKSEKVLQLTIAQQRLDQLQAENARLVEQNRNFKAKCKKSHDIAIQTDMFSVAVENQNLTIPERGCDQPSLKYLNKYVVKDVSSIWFDLGLELIEPGDEDWLYDIQTDNCYDVNVCCKEMLWFWLNEYPDASWNQLIQALKEPNIQLLNLASTIEAMLMPMDEIIKEPMLTLNFSQDENIDNAFLRLSAAITEMIQDVDFFRLQKACIEKAYSPLMPSKATEIIPIVTSAQTFHDMCLKLIKTVYWNFLDIRIIEAMVSASLIAPAYESIKNFKETFFSMTLTRVAPYFSVTRNEPEMYDDDYSQMTIFELYRHQFYLETETLQIGSNMLKICRIVIE